MVQLKSLLSRWWQRIDLVADDPGIERDWAAVREVNAFRNAAGDAAPEPVAAVRTRPQWVKRWSHH
jgi:hypothetical protein